MPLFIFAGVPVRGEGGKFSAKANEDVVIRKRIRPSMLEGYQYVREAGKSGLVRGEYPDCVKDALLFGKGTRPENGGGRGTVHRFSLPDGSGIVREFRRGGLLRFFNRDAYVTNRPLAELHIVDYLWRKGFPVAEPLGVCWWRRWGLLHGRIATKVLDARHLQDYLLASKEPVSGVLQRVGEIICWMHDLGVFHADLQVRNILIAAEMPYIIDFDKARRRPSLSSSARAANLFRLRRSFEKNGLEGSAYQMIREGYGNLPSHRLLSFLYRVKSNVSPSRRKK